MAKFFFISSEGQSAPMALELKNQGHRVRMFVEDNDKRVIYAGLVDKSTGLIPEKDDIIVVDYCGYGNSIDAWRKRGLSVVGPGHMLETLELNNYLGFPFFRSLGIKMPEIQLFPETRLAINFLKTNPGKWYWYSEDYGKNCLSSEMLIRHFSAFPTRRIALQREVKDAYRFTFGGWFDGRRFVPPFFSSVGDYECGVAWIYEQERPRLYVKVLQLLETLLIKEHHVGFVNACLLIDPKGDIYMTDAKFAFPYMKMDLLQFLSFGNFGNELQAFVGRTGINRFSYKAEYAVGIKLEGCDETGVPTDPALMLHKGQVILKDVYLNGGLPFVCGECVAVVGGSGELVWDVFDNAKRLCKQFEVIGKEYPQETCETQRIAVRDLLELYMFDGPYIKAVESKLPDIPVDLSSPSPPSSGGGTAAGGPTPSGSNITTLIHIPPDHGGAPEF